jgi:hypothetical protein
MTGWSPEHHRRRVRSSVIGDDRCGSSPGRDGDACGHGEDQKLTTMRRNWSERLQEVGRERSSASSHRDAKLIGIDWELPVSIGLTRRRRKPWRSFRATRRSSGTSVPASSKLAGARVSVMSNKSRGRKRSKRLGSSCGGGLPFINIGG